jgi:asparagine synthase (glutamine-hydrolysing)
VCGIFGYVQDGVRCENEPSLDVAIASLRHRGPDGEGTFVSRGGEVACGLAHTRLAIIDLSPSGHQPMSTPDARYTITYNGEIYNYRDVRAELEILGERFVSTSDTEVILLAFRRWGASSLQKLRGMFAFAIWDARDRCLFLARDRLGVKPLYYCHSSKSFVFASELRTLLAVGAAGRRLCESGLESYLTFGSVAEPQTMLRDVELLPAGCYAEIRGGDFIVRRFWEPPLRVEASVSFGDAAEEVREVLLKSVALRMIADVPVGIFLSGGMDSSAIVALASRASRRPLETFTMSFDEERFDEAPFAADVAKRFGCNHHVVAMSEARARAEIDEAMAALDQPSADGTNSYFVSKATRAAGQTVALSGIGGDEIFAGYATFRRFQMIMRAEAVLPRAATKILRAGSRLDGKGARAKLLRAAAVLDAGGDPYCTYVALREFFTRGERGRLLSLSSSASRGEPPEFFRRTSAWVRGPSSDVVAAYAVFELTNYLRNTLLRDTDAMGMAHGLEVREPLLDHVLVERLLSLSGSLKLSHRGNKPLLAAAVTELPRAVSRRRKLGFTLPFETWLRGPLRNWTAARLLGRRRERGILHPLEVERVWRDFLSDKGLVSWSHVWALVVLVDWCERHDVYV